MSGLLCFSELNRNLTRRIHINRCQLKGHDIEYKTRQNNAHRITSENYVNLTLVKAIGFS